MKTEKDRIFQVESKIRQAKLDDKTKRENRNRKVSFFLDEKIECRIEVIDKDGDGDGIGDSIRSIWGSNMEFHTDEGKIYISIRGKTKQSAEILARTFLDKMGVKYKIRRG